ASLLWTFGRTLLHNVANRRHPRGRNFIRKNSSATTSGSPEPAFRIEFSTWRSYKQSKRPSLISQVAPRAVSSREISVLFGGSPFKKANNSVSILQGWGRGCRGS